MTMFHLLVFAASGVVSGIAALALPYYVSLPCAAVFFGWSRWAWRKRAIQLHETKDVEPYFTIASATEGAVWGIGVGASLAFVSVWAYHKIQRHFS